MSLESSPVYRETYSAPNTGCNIIVKTDSLTSISVLFKALTTDGEPALFNDKSYTIEISNNGKDFHKLREVNLGTGSTCDQNFSVHNNSVFFNPLDSLYIRFSLPPLGEDISGCIISSSR